MAQATELTTIMSEQEAFGDLARQGLGGPVNTTSLGLARRWGWPEDEAGRMRVNRVLKAWAKAGRIARKSIPGKGQTIVIGTVNNTVNIAVAPPAEPAGRSPGITLPPIGVHHVIAVTIAGLGLYIAWNDLRISSDYGWSLGRTPEAAALFSSVAWAVTAAGLVLWPAGLILWRGGHRGSALLAFGLLCGLVLPMASLAAVGFISVNVSDTSAGRGKIANESATLAAQIGQMTKERAALAETRSAAALEAEIQAAQSQSAVAAVWSRTGGCRDVTQPKSGEACAPLLRLRQALGEASRRDALDAALGDKQTALAALPAVTSADPQTEAAAGVVTWVSRGVASPAASDFAMLRIALFAAVLLMPGALEALAVSVWGLKQGRVG